MLHRLAIFGKHGILASHEVETGVADLGDAPIRRIDHRPLLARAREMTGSLSGYDALYAALADLTSARLVTGDRRLAATARSQLGLEVVDLPGIG